MAVIIEFIESIANIHHTFNEKTFGFSKHQPVKVIVYLGLENFNISEISDFDVYEIDGNRMFPGPEDETATSCI